MAVSKKTSSRIKKRRQPAKKKSAPKKVKKKVTKTKLVLNLQPNRRKKKRGSVLRFIGKVIKKKAIKRKSSAVRKKIIPKRKAHVVKSKGVKIAKKRGFKVKRRELKNGSFETVYVPNSIGGLHGWIDRIQKDKDIRNLLDSGYKLTVRFGNDDIGWNWGHRYIPAKGTGYKFAIEQLHSYIQSYETDPRSGVNPDINNAFGGPMEIVAIVPDFEKPKPVRKKKNKVNRTGRSVSGRKSKSQRFQKFKKSNGGRSYMIWKRSVRKAMKKYRAHLKRKKKSSLRSKARNRKR